jgi:hypothetical protein
MIRSLAAPSALALALMIIAAMTACSSGESIDPARVEAELATDPAPARTGEPATLKATFTGAKFPEEVYVYFEVRTGDRPVFFDAVREGENTFTGSMTFEQAGTFDVYLHLYVEDLHITKKQQVEVQ